MGRHKVFRTNSGSGLYDRAGLSMTKYFSDFDRLFKPLEKGAIILTPNERLSRFLLAQYAHYRVTATGVKAWPSLPCYSINAWFRSQWESLIYREQTPASMLLDATQENALWLSVIRNSKQEVALFNEGAAAGACRRAWNTLVQWQIDYRQESDISDVFKNWMSDYESFCRQHRLIDQSTAINDVNAACELGQLPLPKRIIFYAFDDINPQVQRLIDTARQQACSIETFDPKANGERRCRRFAADNPNDEIKRAALWAAKKIDDHPDATVGIVVPKLMAIREKVERIFTEVFEPQYRRVENSRHASAFNISAGIPLSEVPPVAAALTALKLNFRTVEIEDISRLLLSPFFGKAEELPARAMFESSIRERYLALSVSKFRTLAGEFGRVSEGDDKARSFVEDFYQRLHKLQQFNIATAGHQAPSDWGRSISSQLQVLGWPGERELDTLEYQQVDTWVDSVSQLAKYDYLFPKISCEQAIELIARITFEKQFQAQTSTSPVQVLGLFEAAGLIFDNVWVMNLDDESWPSSINPDPLLPKSLQKIKKMPQASVERELELAEKLTHRFICSGTAVVLSFATRDQDKEYTHSALIDAVRPITQASLAQYEVNSAIACIYNSRALERLHDARGSALLNAESIRGGTQLIKDQAACPFRAYASHRLAAIGQERALPGLGAAERGILIHDTLEYVWKKLGDQAALLAASDKYLDSLIVKAVEISFRSKHQLKEFGERLKEIECARILRLVRAWLEIEKKRPPFSVFFSEVNRNISLGGLAIHIRYDRIDRLEDGSLFVIDYKTGKTTLSSWAGSRPDEPQVPIYGIANSSSVTALAFGQINIDEIAYKGISSSEGVAPGMSLANELTYDLPESWPEILRHWREVLENLAHEFMTGVAEVAPKYGAKTCQYCALQSLCRIKESLPELEDDQPLDSNGSALS